MRTFATLVLASLVIATPAASATGYLVNIGIGGSSWTFGSNVFGGSGDTLDIGLFNEQCTDEADVVDIGIANSEGARSSRCWDAKECQHDQGEDPFGPITDRKLVGSEADETSARCSDESDTVDVGVLNQEGAYGDGYCDGTRCYEPGPTGDETDATDVGVLNTETGDDDDGNDAGVLNCEWNDRRDSTDVGVLNREENDQDDTFDLSVLNDESPEGGDANGLDVGGDSQGLGLDCLHLDVGLPVGPRIPLPRT